MRITKRSTRYAALAVGLAFIAAACGSDDDQLERHAAGTDRSAPTTAAPRPPLQQHRDHRRWRRDHCSSLRMAQR